MAKTDEAKKGEVKKRSPVIIIVLVLVAIGVGVFVGTTLLSKNTTTVVKPIVEIKVPVIKEVTVNLSDEGGKNHLVATVTISYDEENKDIADEIEEKKVEIMDKTRFYLKSKKVEDFTATNEEKLKKDLVGEINKLLVTGQIVNVYFPDKLLVQ